MSECYGACAVRILLYGNPQRIFRKKVFDEFEYIP